MKNIILLFFAVASVAKADLIAKQKAALDAIAKAYSRNEVVYMQRADKIVIYKEGEAANDKAPRGSVGNLEFLVFNRIPPTSRGAKSRFSIGLTLRILEDKVYSSDLLSGVVTIPVSVVESKLDELCRKRGGVPIVVDKNRDEGPAN